MRRRSTPRATRLSESATAVWVQPVIAHDVLTAYRPQPSEQASQYALMTLRSWPTGRPMRPLFEALRVELLALDPNITEEILKLYIAYKAETNVVDIVPQASRLRLSLNLPFPALNDPKGLARDVTNLGRWGNGDVDVGLSDLADIPYVLGLVRQALERQLSNGAAASW